MFISWDTTQLLTLTKLTCGESKLTKTFLKLVNKMFQW